MPGQRAGGVGLCLFGRGPAGLGGGAGAGLLGREGLDRRGVRRELALVGLDLGLGRLDLGGGLLHLGLQLHSRRRFLRQVRFKLLNLAQHSRHLSVRIDVGDFLVRSLLVVGRRGVGDRARSDGDHHTQCGALQQRRIVFHVRFPPAARIAATRTRLEFEPVRPRSICTKIS